MYISLNTLATCAVVFIAAILSIGFPILFLVRPDFFFFFSTLPVIPCVGILVVIVMLMLLRVLNVLSQIVEQINQVERRIEDTRRRVAALEDSPKAE